MKSRSRRPRKNRTCRPNLADMLDSEPAYPGLRNPKQNILGLNEWLMAGRPTAANLFAANQGEHDEFHAA